MQSFKNPRLQSFKTSWGRATFYRILQKRKKATHTVYFLATMFLFMNHSNYADCHVSVYVCTLRKDAKKTCQPPKCQHVCHFFYSTVKMRNIVKYKIPI